MADYVCPNGHEFTPVVEVQCDWCTATVTCEPASRGMALAAEVEHLRNAGDELARAVEAATAPGRTHKHAMRSLPAALARYREKTPQRGVP